MEQKKRKAVLLRVDEDLHKTIQHAQIDSKHIYMNDWWIEAAREKLEREEKKK